MGAAYLGDHYGRVRAGVRVRARVVVGIRVRVRVRVRARVRVRIRVRVRVRIRVRVRVRVWLRVPGRAHTGARHDSTRYGYIGRSHRDRKVGFGAVRVRVRLVLRVW